MHVAILVLGEHACSYFGIRGSEVDLLCHKFTFLYFSRFSFMRMGVSRGLPPEMLALLRTVLPRLSLFHFVHFCGLSFLYFYA